MRRKTEEFEFMEEFIRPSHEDVVRMFRNAKRRKLEWVDRVHRRWEELDRELGTEEVELVR